MSKITNRFHRRIASFLGMAFLFSLLARPASANLVLEFESPKKFTPWHKVETDPIYVKLPKKLQNAVKRTYLWNLEKMNRFLKLNAKQKDLVRGRILEGILPDLTELDYHDDMKLLREYFDDSDDSEAHRAAGEANQ